MRFLLVQSIFCVSCVCCLAGDVSGQDLLARPGQVARFHLPGERVTGRIVSIQQDTVISEEGWTDP
jgi:hypothetical protein